MMDTDILELRNPMSYQYVLHNTQQNTSLFKFPNTKYRDMLEFALAAI